MRAWNHCCSLAMSVITVSECTSFLTLQFDTISNSLGKISCWIKIKGNGLCNLKRGFVLKFKVKIKLVTKMSFFYLEAGKTLEKILHSALLWHMKGDNLNSCRWNVIRLYYPHFTDGNLRHIAIKIYTMWRYYNRESYFLG